MIHITIVGPGGWLSVALWAGMAIGVPTWCYRFGRMVGREDEREEQEQARHDEWMRGHV